MVKRGISKENRINSADNTGPTPNQIDISSLPLINKLTPQDPLQETLLRLFGGKELLRLNEVSQILGLDYKVVYYKATKGDLPAYRFGSRGSVWFVTMNDLVSYMTKNVGRPVRKGVLEELVESLDPLNPEDYRFRQDLDGYIAASVKQVSSEHSLSRPYALAYVVAEVSHLLEFEQGVAAGYSPNGGK